MLFLELLMPVHCQRLVIKIPNKSPHPLNILYIFSIQHQMLILPTPCIQHIHWTHEEIDDDEVCVIVQNCFLP